MIAGVGMGNVIMNMLGMAVAFGMNGALETFVSQSFGQGNLELCGVYLNRGRVVMTMFFLPVAIIMTQVETLM